MKWTYLAAVALLMLRIGAVMAASPANADRLTAPTQADQGSRYSRDGTGGPAYNPTRQVYPDESRIVIGGQTFYYNRYIPFGLR